MHWSSKPASFRWEKVVAIVIMQRVSAKINAIGSYENKFANVNEISFIIFWLREGLNSFNEDTFHKHYNV